MRPSSALESLRAQVRQIEGQHRRAASVLPLGLTDMDSRLPAGGLALGALHEVAGGGNGAIDGAAAALFAAGIAARTRGKVLWCITRPDLFAPALAQAGLKSDRVIYLEGGDDKSVLACFEEGAPRGARRCRRRSRPPADDRFAAASARSRRLWHDRHRTSTVAPPDRSVRFRQPTAAVTRWRVSALPSAPLPVEGVGRPRWLIELIRCRAGESADFELEACNDTGRLALPSDLVHGPGQTEVRRRRASA